MTAVMPYPAMDGHHSLPTSTSDLPAEGMTTGWYGSNSLPYQDQYVNPAVSAGYENSPYAAPATSSEGTPIPPAISTENSPWPVYSKPPQPEFVNGYTTLPPPLSLVPSSIHHARPMSALENRPRSSPSTFGPSAESINWPDPRNGLGIHYTLPDHPSHLSNSYIPGQYHSVIGNEIFASPSPPEIKQPLPRRHYPALAPNPAGISVKRLRDDDEESADANGKRRKRTCSVASADLSEDDRLLVQLKEDEGLPWKDIAARFGSHHGKTFQVAALQMRYKRLREKFRVWQGEDVEALKLAYEYWEKYKWDIISSKMLDFGIQERWPSKHCARKWQKISPAYQGSATPQSGPPAMLPHSQYSSPEHGPNHFAFVPIH